MADQSPHPGKPNCWQPPAHTTQPAGPAATHDPAENHQRSGGLDYCDPGVLRVLRRRSLAALRNAVEPVPPRQFARFLTHWQGIAQPLRGTAGLLAAVQQLAGYPVPASSLESLVLPARVRDYTPAMLDELLAAGGVYSQLHQAQFGIYENGHGVPPRTQDIRPATTLVTA